MISNRTKSIALLGGIFLTGCVAGIGTTLAGEYYIIRSVSKKMAGPASGVSTMVMERLSQKLSLTAEQEQAIKPIVDARVITFREKRNNCAGEMSAIVRDGITELSPFLTDRQKDSITARWNRFSGTVGAHTSIDLGKVTNDGVVVGKDAEDKAAVGR